MPRDGAAPAARPAWDGPLLPGFARGLRFSFHRRSDGLVAVVESRGTEVITASAVDRDTAREMLAELQAAVG